MNRIWAIMALAFIGLVGCGAPPAKADFSGVPERVLGKPNAPVVVEEFVSLTCSHCAEFYNSVLPELEKRYVETGKVKFILRDFPLDGIALKAAALARCMPEDQFYPLVKTLYKGLAGWAMSATPEVNLVQYARLGGLSEEKAKACLNDEKMQNAIIAGRMEASGKLHVEATPTFVINNGAVVIKGTQNVQAFADAFDKLLAAKK